MTVPLALTMLAAGLLPTEPAPAPTDAAAEAAPTDAAAKPAEPPTPGSRARAA